MWHPAIGAAATFFDERFYYGEANANTHGDNNIVGAAAADAGHADADASNGGVAVSGAFGNSTATSSADNSGAFAGAAFSSTADTTTAIPTCSGPGIAAGLRSDGHFCLDVAGNIISG